MIRGIPSRLVKERLGTAASGLGKDVLPLTPRLLSRAEGDAHHNTAPRRSESTEVNHLSRGAVTAMNYCTVRAVQRHSQQQRRGIHSCAGLVLGPLDSLVHSFSPSTSSLASDILVGGVIKKKKKETFEQTTWASWRARLSMVCV